MSASLGKTRVHILLNYFKKIVFAGFNGSDTKSRVHLQRDCNRSVTFSIFHLLIGLRQLCNIWNDVSNAFIDALAGNNKQTTAKKADCCWKKMSQLFVGVSPTTSVEKLMLEYAE